MAKRDFEEVEFENFFNSKGVEVENYEPKRKSFLSVIGALTGFVGVSVLLGALIAIPGLVWGSAAAQVAAPAAEFWKSLPEELPEISIGERNQLVDRNGKVFAEVWTEDRIVLDSLDQISPLAIDALIDTEDKRFYDHGGFDAVGTARAAISSGGGSGITQQLVKNLQFYNLAGRDKQAEATETSYNRKVRELKYAMSYEKSHTKSEILLQYFNTVSFGSPNIYSIESAANYFFGKSAKDLTIAESAALVGSVKNPVIYNLDSDDTDTIATWKNRQLTVIDRMLVEGSITEAQATEAAAQELNLVRQSASEGGCSSSAYAFYCDYVMDYLMESPRFGETVEERSAILAKGGLTINTYMDPAAIDAMNQQLANEFGVENRLVAPTAIVQPGTGGVVAMAQNREYGSGPGRTNIDLPEVDSGTGSTYKMIALAAALEVQPESALTFGSACPFYPGPNYDFPPGGFGNSVGCGYQNGALNYRQATAWSSNTWYLTLATKIGMDKIFDMSNRLGLRTDGLSERALATVLGSKENSPLKMAAAFATFANEGVFCPATPVVSYEYKDGTAPAVPETYDPTIDSCRSVMSPATASGVLKAMRANTYKGEVPNAFGEVAQINGYDAVGKSGTNEHLNVTWAQVSKNYSIFTNIYDMDNPNRGVAGGYWRGGQTTFDTAARTSSDLLRTVVAVTNPPRTGLNYNSTDRTFVDVPVDRREFFTVPALTGMSPEQALATALSLGVTAEVSKETRPTPDLFKSGVVVEQSLEAGTQLPMGTKKEMLLYLGE